MNCIFDYKLRSIRFSGILLIIRIHSYLHKVANIFNRNKTLYCLFTGREAVLHQLFGRLEFFQLLCGEIMGNTKEKRFTVE